MHNLRRILPPLLALVLLAALGGWYWTRFVAAGEDGPLAASGTVEAVEMTLAPEIGGRLAEILVVEGERVSAGELLFRLDDELLLAQRRRAEATLRAAMAGEAVARTGVEMAQAGRESARSRLSSAEIGVEAAQVQHEMALQVAHQAESPERTASWVQDPLDEFSLPAWYFDKPEEIAALEVEVEAARQAMELEREAYDQLLERPGSAGLLRAEERLANARAAFEVAQEVLERAEAGDEASLEDFARESFEVAQAELEAAQLAYDRLLSEESAAEVLEARARLAVAQERYETARDRLDRRLTGDESLQVRSAEIALRQAESGVAAAGAALAQAEVAVWQAEARLEQAVEAMGQARAELAAIEAQLERLRVYAPAPGVVVTRAAEPGEVVQPGATVLTLATLDDLSITVYVPEDRYGQIRLGQAAKVTVDSFPGESFRAEVTRIADQAEFTPRNVQTEEGRRTTVFAIDLSVVDPQGKLKPGMPADVSFED